MPIATYDRAADALSIDLLPGATRARTEEKGPGELLHYDAEDRLIEVEIIGASARYPMAELERIGSPAVWLSLAQAAKESGLSPVTLRVQIRNKKLEAEKKGTDWMVSDAALETYLANRAPSGRKPAGIVQHLIGKPPARKKSPKSVKRFIGKPAKTGRS